MTRSTALALALLLALSGTAAAHYHILIRDDGPFTTRGKATVLHYAYGHPFEAERSAAAKPAKVVVRTPSDRTLDLSKGLTAQGPAATRSWRLAFTPKERGDHWIVVTSAPRRHGAEERIDIAKLDLNVSAVQKGWDATLSLPVELVPLTRPYGLPVGVTLRAKALAAGKPLAGAKVEVERYNAVRPKTIPPDAFVTRVEKTDARGVFAATLDHAGWWVLAVEGKPRAVKRGEHTVQQSYRCCLWVHVGR